MRIWMVITSMALVACAPAVQPSATSTREHRQQQAHVSEMDTGFLYLAAEQAVQKGNPELAIRFLEALVRKDASAVKPRIRLTELLLQTGHPQQAKKHLDVLLGMRGLPPETSGKIHILHAQHLTLSGKKTDAIQTLREALRETPDAFSTRLMLIQLLAGEKRFDEAHQTIREGLKLNVHPQLYQLDAELYMREGQPKKAEQSLRAMLKLVPDEAGPVLMLGRLAVSQKDMIKAEEILREFLAHHPESLVVSNALGRLLVQQGRGKEAIAIYEDISHRTGEHPEILTALGLLYYQQKNYDHAIATFRKVLIKRPDNQGRFYLAASLEAVKKNAEAAKLYRQIKRGSPNYTDAQLRLVAMDMQAGKAAAALRRLRQLIKEHPKLAEAYTMLSAVLLQQKKHHRLLDETEPALQLAKVPAQLLFNRAAAYEGLKQYGKAANQLRKLFIIEPNNAEALNFLGYVYAEQGIRLNEAEDLIRRALKQKPDDGYYLDSLAWVYYKRGEYSKALGFQQKAVRKIPDDPVMQEHLGDILWQANQHEAARSAWKQALKLGHEEAGRVQKKISKGL